MTTRRTDLYIVAGYTPVVMLLVIVGGALAALAIDGPDAMRAFLDGIAACVHAIAGLDHRRKPTPSATTPADQGKRTPCEPRL